MNGAIIVNHYEKSGIIGLHCMQKESIMSFILVNGHTPLFPLELSKKNSISLVGYSQAIYSSERLKIWSNRLFFHLKAYPALLCTMRSVQHVITEKS